MSELIRMVDEETGEIGTFVPEGADYTIKHKSDIERERYYATLPYKKRMYNGNSYVMSSNDEVASILSELSLNEAGALIKLLLILRVNKGGKLMDIDGRPYNKTFLSNVLGRSKKGGANIIDRLMEIGVVAKIDDYYTINERYHIMGHNTFSGEFTKLYTVQTRAKIAKLRLNEIGLLYKIMPFFHFSEYYLCVDSNSKREDIDYMGRETLASAIGHAPDTVGRLMRKLQSAGIILVTGTKNEVRYLVHPDILFRQAEGTETEWTIAVRKLFDDHAKKAR